jgi:diguanylate cyclase (GGDEF)-like protein
LSQRHGSGLALLYLDVDEFKTINDQFGHITGDRVLVAIAEQLVAAVRSTDTVARLGGDEFVVVYEQLSDPVGDAVTLAERISTAISASSATGCRVSASIGIAVADAATQPDELIRRADHAMYAAKRHGPGRYHLAGAN